MSDVAQIVIRIPWAGSVNLWLLRGDPLTLIDSGPVVDDALPALERGLAGHGVSVDELDLILITHHHLDHSALAPSIRERSGAQIAAHSGTARWLREYRERTGDEHRFARALMAAHGVSDDLIARTAPFFDYIRRSGTAYETDRVLLDGDTILAGGRTLRVVYRPGHSATDTLFIDDVAREAFVGDHLLAKIVSAELAPTELPGNERRRGLVEYLSNLRTTAGMQLETCYPGHGATIHDHRRLIEERLAFHADRLDLIARHVEAGCATAFEVARRLWSDEAAETQPVLAIWEVLGHLDILVNRGAVLEQVDDRGRHYFRPRDAVEDAAASPSRP